MIKKFIFIILALSVILLSGCSNKNSSLNLDKREIKMSNNSESKFDNNADEGMVESSNEEVIIEEVLTKEVSKGVMETSSEYIDDWNYFEDRVAGISLQYPENVSMEDDEKDTQFKLRVEIDDINTLEGPLGLDVETAMANMEALKNGNNEGGVDFPLEGSKHIIKIKDTYAQDFVVLARFEVCDVTFERKLYLFNNNQQILITLKAPKDQMINALSDYFKKDDANCGEEDVWDFDKQSQLYTDLIEGKDLGIANEWFKAFDEIIDTVFLIDTSEEESLLDRDINAEVANPASVFCEDNGGVLEIVREENGEIGYCNFEDGSKCEEWSFFRGECRVGNGI